MEISTSVHLFLRIRGDERRKDREQIEDAKNQPANNRQRALSQLAPEDSAWRLRRRIQWCSLGNPGSSRLSHTRFLDRPARAVGRRSDFRPPTPPKPSAPTP